MSGKVYWARLVLKRFFKLSNRRLRPQNEAWWALVIQGSGLILLVSLMWGVKNEFVAGSLLLGGAACLLPNIYLYCRIFRYFGAQNARNMVRALYGGELVKLLLTAGIFAALAILSKKPLLSWLLPLYLFIGYFYTQILFWVAPIFWGLIKNWTKNRS